MQTIAGPEASRPPPSSLPSASPPPPPTSVEPPLSLHDLRSPGRPPTVPPRTESSRSFDASQLSSARNHGAAARDRVGNGAGATGGGEGATEAQPHFMRPTQRYRDGGCPAARFWFPRGMCLLPEDNCIVIADSRNHMLRLLVPSQALLAPATPLRALLPKQELSRLGASGNEIPRHTSSAAFGRRTSRPRATGGGSTAYVDMEDEDGMHLTSAADMAERGNRAKGLPKPTDPPSCVAEQQPFQRQRW